MISQKIFKLIDDGQIVLRLYNPKTDYEGVLKVLHESYMKDENTFHAFEMNKPDALPARLEFESFINFLLKSGLSLVARHIPSDRIAGFFINTIRLYPEPRRLNIFEEFRNTVHTRELRNMFNYESLGDKDLDLFNRFNIDNFFECVYLATLSDFRGRSIGHNLVECSVELARNVARGIYPRGMTNDFRGKTPKLIYVSSSSSYTNRIAEKLGFVELRSTPFSEVKIDGIPISARIPPQHTHFTSFVLHI